jgi:hypothetical protein
VGWSNKIHTQGRQLDKASNVLRFAFQPTRRHMMLSSTSPIKTPGRAILRSCFIKAFVCHSEVAFVGSEKRKIQAIQACSAICNHRVSRVELITFRVCFCGSQNHRTRMFPISRVECCEAVCRARQPSIYLLRDLRKLSRKSKTNAIQMSVSTTGRRPAGRRSRRLGRSHPDLGGVSMSF